MRWWYQLNRREPHYVTNENIGEAKDALRDILYVYHQALTSRQLDVELDLGTFDALERGISAERMESMATRGP